MNTTPPTLSIPAPARRGRAGLFAGILLVVSAATPVFAADTVAEWSEQVWAEARQGNTAELEKILDQIPAGQDGATVQRVRELVALRKQHQAEAAANRTAEREKAMTEMVAQVESGDLTKSLTSAVALMAPSG